MDGQMAAGAVFMCRLCNLFSPSHSQLLDHCSQVHFQQELPGDIIISLQPLSPRAAEAPPETHVKRKRGRPKGSTKKTNKPDSPSHTEDNTEREGESKDKEQVQGESNLEILELECKECHRSFSNRRQILKHICLKEVVEEEDEDDDSSYGSPKTKRRPRPLFENQSGISKEGSSSCKKSVIKVFLTEDETLPGVSKMVPVEESFTEGQSASVQVTPQSQPQEVESEAAVSSDNPKTDQGPRLNPTAETGASKGFQEYSIKTDISSSVQNQLKIFTCEFCNKIFKFRHSLVAHLRIHTQEKPFTCPHCDYASSIKANLNVHLRKHTGDKFHCDYCSFTCLSSGHLKVHIERVHLKMKQHCSFCKSKYSDVKNLLKHIEKHHNLKDAAVNKIYQELRLKTRQGLRQLLFHCPTCKRCFKNRQERERHLLIHEPQRPFGCMLCEYAATKLSGLAAHVRKHFFLYVCCVCKGIFVSCHRLRTHLTVSHPELENEQAFNDCINSSYQLIHPGIGIWVHNAEKRIEQKGQDEDMIEKVLVNGDSQEELQRRATNEQEAGEIKNFPLGMNKSNSDSDSESPEMQQVLEQEPGMHLENEASSQSSQNELCQTSSLENASPTETEDKPVMSADWTAADENSINNPAENTDEREEHRQWVSSPEISNTGLSEATDGNQENMIIPINTCDATNSIPSNLPLVDDKTPLSKKESEVPYENAFQQVLSSLQKTRLSMEALQQLRKFYGDLECQYCGKLYPLFILKMYPNIFIESLRSTGKLFAFKVHYNIHVRTHTKEHLQFCAQCNYSSVTKSSLNRHMIQKHSDLLLSCPNVDCKYTTTDKYQLQAHVRRFHEETKYVACPVCNNNYPEPKLRQHIRKIHPDSVPVEGKGRMEKRADKCPYCDSYFLENSNDFQQHIWAHQGVKPYSCNMCDYAGYRKSNLTLHMNRHTTDKSHLCDLCGKKFKTKVTLKSHSLSHNSEGKRFQCSECNFSSALKPSLLRHMDQHSTVKPFRCAHCHYSCNNSGSLKRHYKKKHPDQKYQDAEAEVFHPEDQKEQGALKCPVCEFVYGTKWELNCHLKNKHNLNVLEISFEESAAVETQYVPVENEVQLTEVPVEALQDSEAVNILQQITELNSETRTVITPMVAMAPGTVAVMKQLQVAEEQEIGNNQLMVVNADEDLAADQVMVVEEADGLEALTVLTQGDNTHHYIVYVEEQTVEIN